MAEKAVKLPTEDRDALARDIEAAGDTDDLEALVHSYRERHAHTKARRPKTRTLVQRLIKDVDEAKHAIGDPSEVHPRALARFAEDLRPAAHFVVELADRADHPDADADPYDTIREKLSALTKKLDGSE